ncbi:hypothetical protein [Desmospora activa]|uniref:hypothetical protein n=1 Tax=Desmospora activa TaxID=500615 RepID=UPI001473CA1D|nr:hypothetical protein [Desmospora activa]
MSAGEEPAGFSAVIGNRAILCLQHGIIRGGTAGVKPSRPCQGWEGYLLRAMD